MIFFFQCCRLAIQNNRRQLDLPDLKPQVLEWGKYFCRKPIQTKKVNTVKNAIESEI